VRPLALALALASAPAAYGQDQGTWQAGLGGGRVWQDVDAPLDHGWEFVPRLGFFVSDGLAIEGELAVATGPMEESSGRWLSVTPRAHLVGYLVRDFALRPYVLGGVGLELALPTGDEEHVHSPAFGVRLYAAPGLQVNITEAFALRADVRTGLTLSTLDDRHRVLAGFELTFGVQIAF